MSDYYDYGSSWDDWSYWSNDSWSDIDYSYDYSYDYYSDWGGTDDSWNYASYGSYYDDSYYDDNYYYSYSYDDSNSYDSYYDTDGSDAWGGDLYVGSDSVTDGYDYTFDFAADFGWGYDSWGYDESDWYVTEEYYETEYYSTDYYEYDYSNYYYDEYFVEPYYSYSLDYYYSWDFYVTPAPIIEVIYTTLTIDAGMAGTPIAWTDGQVGFAGTIHQASGDQAYGSWAGTIQGSGYDDTILALGAWTAPGTSIAGGRGNDTLVVSGQGGGATVAGGGGADQFIIDFRHDPWAAVSGWAQINDFNPGQGDAVTLMLDAGHDPLIYAVDTAYGLDVVIDSGDGFFDLYFAGQTTASFDPGWIALA